MYKIFSQVEKKKLIHIITRVPDYQEKEVRVNLSPDDAELQVGIISMPKEKHVLPHKHQGERKGADPWLKYVSRSSAEILPATHELWLVFDGEIEVALFDIDCSFLSTRVLYRGDMLLTMGGGHEFRSYGQSTLIECKNGKYYGPDYTTFVGVRDNV